MDDNMVALEEQAQVTDIDDAALDEKPSILFWIFMGFLCLTGVGTIVFGILWWKRGKKLKQAQETLAELQKNQATSAAAPVEEPKNVVETKEEEPKVEENKA